MTASMVLGETEGKREITRGGERPRRINVQNLAAVLFLLFL
jgi:hypothetical protein